MSAMSAIEQSIKQTMWRALGYMLKSLGKGDWYSYVPFSFDLETDMTQALCNSIIKFCDDSGDNSIKKKLRVLPLLGTTNAVNLLPD